MKQEKEEAKLYKMMHGSHYYMVAHESIQEGDYYFRFDIHTLGGHPVERCDSQKLAELINSANAKRETIHRISAKVIESNDPVLNAMGIPQ